MPSDVVTRVADAVMSNVGRAIVNKEDEVRFCLVTLLCEGHLLIEDVPGVGKTMLAKSLARSRAKVGMCYRACEFRNRRRQERKRRPSTWQIANRSRP